MKKERNRHIEKLAEIKAKKYNQGGLSPMPANGTEGYADGGSVNSDLSDIGQGVQDYQNLSVFDKLKMAAKGIDPMTGKPKQMFEGGQTSPVARPELIEALKKALGTDTPPEPEKTEEEKYEEIRRKNRQQFGG